MPKSMTTVEIRGRTPAGAACLAVLARAGIPARITFTDNSQAEVALVSGAVLRDVQIADTLTHDVIEVGINRRLREDTADDTPFNPVDLCVVSRTALMDSLTVGLGDASPRNKSHSKLQVDAREFRLGHPGIRDDTILPLSSAEEVLQIEWEGDSGKPSRWIQLTGESLLEVRGQAHLVQTPARSALIVVVPMAALVESSIALPDIAHRLLVHPALRADLPPGGPDLASLRLLTTGSPVPISLDGGVSVHVGVAAGMADPVLLDRELRSGIVAAREIAEAIQEDRVSLSRLSRMTRAWAKVEKELPAFA